jgi:hypothetical protein
VSAIDGRWRASIGSAVAALGGIASFELTATGLDLSFSLCALGGCAEAKNAPLGTAFEVAGLVCLLAALVASVRLSNRPFALTRALLAVPTVGTLGLVLIAISAPDFGEGGQNASLVVLVVTFTGVLVPPRAPGWWLVAGSTGAVVASLLGESVRVGVIAGTALFLAGIVGIDATLVPPRSQAPGR